jgi:hypothetical protein
MLYVDTPMVKSDVSVSFPTRSRRKKADNQLVSCVRPFVPLRLSRLNRRLERMDRGERQNTVRLVLLELDGGSHHRTTVIVIDVQIST